MFSNLWKWLRRGLILAGLAGAWQASGGIRKLPGIGPSLPWNANPLTMLEHDQVLVCVQMDDGRAGPVEIQVSDGTPSGEFRLVFWDNHLGHCNKLELSQLGHFWLLPQRQFMFLAGASVTVWDNGWTTHDLKPEQGGWWVH